MSRKKNEQTIKELLRIEGVGAKGFGILPKYAMQDADLGLWAKLLYAYLCSLAGSGNQTWPKRTTILADLGISKDIYYRAQKQLIDQGYLGITQTRKGQRRGANIYTLISAPKKFRNSAAASKSPPGSLRDRVIAGGLKAGGYGMIPRLVLQDDRLWVKAKLVYSYMATFAGAGQSAFPAAQIAAKQLNLGERAWQRALRELSQLGYIKIVQRRTEGRFTTCDYILVDNPKPAKKQKKSPSGEKNRKDIIAPDVRNKDIEESSPDVRNKDIEKSSPDVRNKDIEKSSPDVRNKDIEESSPDVRNKDIEKSSPDVKNKDIETPAPDVTLSDIQKPDIQEPDIQNKDSISSNSIYLVTDISSINSTYPSAPKQPCLGQGGSAQMDGIEESEKERRLDDLSKRLMISDAEVIYGADAPIVRGIWSMLRAVLTASGDTFQLGGQRMSKEKLWALDSDLVTYVLICLTRRQSEKPIRNMRNYLLASLYHADETIDAFYDAEIRSHLR